MRTLGVDYGLKRVGLAISDPMGWSAQGIGTIVMDLEQEFFALLTQIVEEREVEEIVVGLPRNMDGTLGRQAELTVEFGKKLEELFNLPVIMWDERMSTMEAHRTLSMQKVTLKKRKELVDRIATQLILQSYLVSKNQKTNSENETDS